MISRRCIWTVAALFLVMGLTIWALSLYIWGGQNYREGFRAGVDRQRIVNPSQEYIESGTSFCWSDGNWWHVRPMRNGFLRIK